MVPFTWVPNNGSSKDEARTNGAADPRIRASHLSAETANSMEFREACQKIGPAGPGRLPVREPSREATR